MQTALLSCPVLPLPCYLRSLTLSFYFQQHVKLKLKLFVCLFNAIHFWVLSEGQRAEAFLTALTLPPSLPPSLACLPFPGVANRASPCFGEKKKKKETLKTSYF